jgi:hypothetical protein
VLTGISASLQHPAVVAGGRPLGLTSDSSFSERRRLGALNPKYLRGSSAFSAVPERALVLGIERCIDQLVRNTTKL